MVNTRAQEPTIACKIIEMVKKLAATSSLTDYYAPQTQTFLEEIDALRKQNKGNELTLLDGLLDNYCRSCDYYTKLPEQDRLKMQSRIDKIRAGLKELKEDLMGLNNVQLSCALDSDTLRRTTRLIKALETFIAKLDVNKTLSATTFQAARKTSFYSTMKAPKYLFDEVDIAKELKKMCEEIRDKIGSKDTMPKGLIIDFMAALCDALYSCENILAHEVELSQELLHCISKEIEDLRKNHMELAQAGEDLQKAIANYQLQKS